MLELAAEKLVTIGHDAVAGSHVAGHADVVEPLLDVAKCGKARPIFGIAHEHYVGASDGELRITGEIMFGQIVVPAPTVFATPNQFPQSSR